MLNPIATALKALQISIYVIIMLLRAVIINALAVGIQSLLNILATLNRIEIRHAHRYLGFRDDLLAYLLIIVRIHAMGC